MARYVKVVILTIIAVVAAHQPLAAQFQVERIASGLNSPLYVTSAPGDSDRLFILEQDGDIEIYKHSTGAMNGTSFLDLSSSTFCCGERGLLGLAFDPDYQTNGLFYVNVTNNSGDTEIRRYQVSANPDQATAASGTVILSYNQPFSNHNGGWIGFNPIPNAANDNNQYLYISSGDGGSGGDPLDHGENPHTLLGAILRIDVDAATYTVPASNPFADGVDGAPEVWAYGLRNPWRASFDRQTGNFYIGDVGQGAWEEIDVQLASSTGGENYGWDLREGLHTFEGAKPAGAIDPIHEYSHSVGFSVTGGYVYRGPIAELQGQYFFADYVTERIWSLQFDGSDPTTHDGTNYSSFTERTTQFTPDIGSIDQIASFGEDNAGNLYIVDLGGEVFMVVPEPSTYALTLASLALVTLFSWRARRTR